MRGLSGQARKVELAEPAIRAHRHAMAAAMSQSMNMSGKRGQRGHGGQESYYSSGDPTSNHLTVDKKRASSSQKYAEPIRTERSSYSDDEGKRNTLVTQKKLDNDGEWDLIVQYNQREGRRIASMAAQEINKKKEENKRYLDQQVLEHERRRKKEERSKIEFIREQKERLRRLEEEEARKEIARAERNARVKVEQDVACQLVRERKAKEKELVRKDDMAMLKRIQIENQKAREKEQVKLMKEKERAKEMKEGLVRQLAIKAQAKKFEAEEERQLQIAARKKADDEERKRKEALQELLDKMKSKQKIGESTAADVAAIARADEERALREQAAHDEKKRKEEADKVRARQVAQTAVLESLEYQLKLKKERAEQVEKERRKEAIALAADAEKAHQEATANMEVQEKKRREYYNVLTAHIEKKKDMKLKGVGMSKNERQLNSKVLAKMEAEMSGDF